MAHIHTNPGEHDWTVSAFIVQTHEDEPRILLHQHKKLAMLLPFGGHVEVTETPWQAIIHELREESGYAIDQLELLQPKDRITELAKVDLHPQPVCINTHEFADLEHSHTDITYAFTTSSPPKYQPATGESPDIQSFTRTELLSLPPEKTYENIAQIGLFILDTCFPSWEAVKPVVFTS